MLRLSRELPWKQVHALQRGWGLVCRSRRRELPSSKLLLEVSHCSSSTKTARDMRVLIWKEITCEVSLLLGTLGKGFSK